jgi:hypothetical protein
MKRALFVLVVSFLLALGASAWSQCPEDEYDLGECDTVVAEVYETANELVPIMFLVTHDRFDDMDSLAGFVLPITISERTNPSMYCSISLHWNATSMLYLSPDFDRSIYRHILSDPPDTLYRNRMAALEGDFSNRGWDFTVLDLGDEISHFYFSVVPTSDQNQRWWEGERVLLVTATLRVQDSMTVCIDTTFWPPANRLQAANFDATTFIPRHYFPYCFKITYSDVRETHGSEEARPSDFQLSQNYPNPFNAATNIEFAVIKATRVTLEVFNIVGQKVKTLVDQDMKPGTYVADWDSKDENGQPVSSGIYFYRMQAGDFSDMKKMLLLK